jgi:hypothetical protein
VTSLGAAGCVTGLLLPWLKVSPFVPVAAEAPPWAEAFDAELPPAPPREIEVEDEPLVELAPLAELEVLLEVGDKICASAWRIAARVAAVTAIEMKLKRWLRIAWLRV